VSNTVRTALSLFGFLVVVGILVSDRFHDLSDAVPVSVYFYIVVVSVAGMTVLGSYAWWQHYNGRKMHPTVDRLKKWLDSTNWPI
jgi:predicted MFS family arabinose efflux permease